MCTRKIRTFKSISTKELEEINGGVIPYVLAGTFIYGVIAGYTDEKCIMDNGRHWYCTKLN